MERRRRTEGGEAPGWQGATTENTGVYLREELRSQRGCIAGRMQPALHHGLLAKTVCSACPEQRREPSGRLLRIIVFEA